FLGRVFITHALLCTVIWFEINLPQWSGILSPESFTKDLVNRLSGSHRVALSKYGSLYKEGKMSDTELKQ
ncbi:MAG: hypothetical protein M3Z35_17225, partial [Nitrospirota bacterium]|nr:hypothetical protein [Nitrospirota bacterium]